MSEAATVVTDRIPRAVAMVKVFISIYCKLFWSLLEGQVLSCKSDSMQSMYKIRPTVELLYGIHAYIRSLLDTDDRAGLRLPAIEGSRVSSAFGQSSLANGPKDDAFHS